MARDAFQKLQNLRVAPRFQEAVDLGSLTIRSKPFHDSEVLYFVISGGKFRYSADIDISFHE